MVKQISALFFEAEKRIHTELQDRAESVAYHIAGGDIDSAEYVWEDGLVNVSVSETVEDFSIRWMITSHEYIANTYWPEGL